MLLYSSSAQAAEKTEVYVAKQKVTVTAQALSEALKAYIQAETVAKGGYILIEDPLDGTLVKLKPVKLDDGSHIHCLGEDRFLSWGEFKGVKGEIYLLDFYFDLKGGSLKMSAPLSIYSKDKVKRYDWDESGRFMKKKSLN
jgi:hypothetical protein